MKFNKMKGYLSEHLQSVNEKLDMHTDNVREWIS